MTSGLAHCSTVHVIIQVLFPCMGLALHPSPLFRLCSTTLDFLGIVLGGLLGHLEGGGGGVWYVMWVFGFCFMFMFSCLLFWSLVTVLALSCDSLVCGSCSDWFFALCVMFSLVVLVMCPFSHWLFLVMWPAFWDIIALLLTLLLVKYTLNCVTCRWWVCVSVHAMPCHAMPCHAKSVQVKSVHAKSSLFKLKAFPHWAWKSETYFGCDVTLE